jgi:hypothetical protein
MMGGKCRCRGDEGCLNIALIAADPNHELHCACLSAARITLGPPLRPLATNPGEKFGLGYERRIVLGKQRGSGTDERLEASHDNVAPAWAVVG